jgi:hypothetical protein
MAGREIGLPLGPQRPDLRLGGLGRRFIRKMVRRRNHTAPARTRIPFRATQFSSNNLRATGAATSLIRTPAARVGLKPAEVYSSTSSTLCVLPPEGLV